MDIIYEKSSWEILDHPTIKPRNQHLSSFPISQALSRYASLRVCQLGIIQSPIFKSRYTLSPSPTLHSTLPQPYNPTNSSAPPRPPQDPPPSAQVDSASHSSAPPSPPPYPAHSHTSPHPSPTPPSSTHAYASSPPS